MPKTIEHVHWPDAPDLWMPYAPAIKVKGGTTIYLADVMAAPAYHHHPHRPASSIACRTIWPVKPTRRWKISSAV